MSTSPDAKLQRGAKLCKPGVVVKTPNKKSAVLLCQTARCTLLASRVLTTTDFQTCHSCDMSIHVHQDQFGHLCFRLLRIQDPFLRKGCVQDAVCWILGTYYSPYLASLQDMVVDTRQARLHTLYTLHTDMLPCKLR